MRSPSTLKSLSSRWLRSLVVINSFWYCFVLLRSCLEMSTHLLRGLRILLELTSLRTLLFTKSRNDILQLTNRHKHLDNSFSILFLQSNNYILILKLNVKPNIYILQEIKLIKSKIYSYHTSKDSSWYSPKRGSNMFSLLHLIIFPLFIYFS